MATATAGKASEGGPIVKAEARPFEVRYIPFGEREEVRLNIKMVRDFLCTPTRTGQLPSDADVVRFAMLCKAQGLNPWVFDAYLVGYDTQDGPKFNLITSHQAFLKRAEASPQYDGMRSGVVVVPEGGEPIKREGDLVYKSEQLIGGWAEVFRKDRLIPSTDTLSLAVFSTGRSRWKDDPAGQICKCAEASAIRKAYPSSLSGLRCREEMDAVHAAVVTQKRETVVAEGGFGAGATAGEVTRPGSTPTTPAALTDMPDRRLVLPTHLRPDADDKRPLAVYLVDRIRGGSAKDRGAIAVALPSCGLLAEDLMTVVSALSEANEADAAKEMAETREPEQERPVRTEPPRPQPVERVLEAIRKAKTALALEMVANRWAGDGAAEFEDFAELISAAFVAKRERLEEGEGK